MLRLALVSKAFSRSPWEYVTGRSPAGSLVGLSFDYMVWSALNDEQRKAEGQGTTMGMQGPQWPPPAPTFGPEIGQFKRPVRVN